MSFFERAKNVIELLLQIRRPTVPLALAQSRYDPMIVALGAALTDEFGVEWTVYRPAELDRTGKRWEYTTQCLTSTRRLDDFPDWSARFATVVESVAQVNQFGVLGSDPKPLPDEEGSVPFESHFRQNEDDDAEFVMIGPADIGPSRLARDVIGGNIEMDVDSQGTTIVIMVAVPAGQD